MNHMVTKFFDDLDDIEDFFNSFFENPQTQVNDYSITILSSGKIFCYVVFEDVKN